MNQIIDAPLAYDNGLQSDVTPKMPNKVTLKLWERLRNLSQGGKETASSEGATATPVIASSAPVQFALLRDLGVITVPDTYLHDMQLALFARQHREMFSHYHDEITGQNFDNPTRILKPGESFHVRAFTQVVMGPTTAKERLAFLGAHKAVYTGAQGASIVFEEKRDQLPRGKTYFSFDEVDRLWKDGRGSRQITGIDCHSVGNFRFTLGHFDQPWLCSDVLLGFFDTG